MTSAGTTYGRRIEAGTELYRIHRTRPGSEAFCDTHPKRGRFNLVDVAGWGTCYLSPTPLGAMIETLGRVLTRPRRDVDDRRLSIIPLRRDIDLFDLTKPTARSAYTHAGLDLTGKTDSGESYELPQRLAELAHHDHYDGIYYSASHDPSHQAKCIAVFGPAGPNETTDALGQPKTDHIPRGLIDACERIFGLRIMPDPPNNC